LCKEKRASYRYRKVHFSLSRDSFAKTEKGQPVPRLEVLRRRSKSVLGGRHDRSQAYVTVLLPLLSFVDFPVVNAYPLVSAHALMNLNSASRDAKSSSGGRQSSGNSSTEVWLIAQMKTRSRLCELGGTR
jgi:hypothetical protein